MKSQAPQQIGGFRLTQKLFFIFVLFLFLIVNSWAFTFTTVLDFQESFRNVEQYSFPSIILTSSLKDKVHVALLSVYNYISSGDEASKTAFEAEFTGAINDEYALFQLSQTTTDFQFTQAFNDKLLGIYNAADTLIKTYETNPTDPAVVDQLSNLNGLRDDFNSFLETKVTSQISAQIESATQNINNTVTTIQYYLIGVSIIVVMIIIGLIWFVTSNISRPVRRLTTAVQAFGKGKFTPVKIPHNDELGLFAQTFNTMAENIGASQRALEEELAKTKELDRQKSEFLSIAAHQLRTPMAGIRWVAQMLFDGDMGNLNNEQKHHLGNGLENINRMIKLINDLLDVTKIEEQKFNYQFAQADMREVVNEAIQRLNPLASEKKVTIVTVYTPNEPLLVEIDKEKIELAINNLIDNAIKYSKPDGVVEVGVALQDANLAGYIKDHGLGIPKSSQAEVFSKFFRGPNILTVVTEGSGLGLFIVKDIIGKHDGKIWFTSTENSGTTFYWSLPLTQPITTEPVTSSVAPV